MAGAMRLVALVYERALSDRIGLEFELDWIRVGVSGGAFPAGSGSAW